MNKSNLFTLFLAGVLVVIGSELLVDDYLKTPVLKNSQADVLDVGAATTQGSANAQTKGTQALSTLAQTAKTANVQNAQVAPAQTTTGQIAQISALQNQEAGGPQITFSMIIKAGFAQTTLQRAPFTGMLFDTIDLQNSLSVPVLQQYLLKNNVARAATFYEIHLQNKEMAGEVFSLIKQKAAAQAGALLNASNGFGEGSFYINYLDNTNHAFLVVKKGSSVYALTYVKDYHPYIAKLIQLLP
ncbi:MAG: hypothetical protein WC843_03000 [Candidatus Gracilibacteria bacterium]|jgi:hypothetical protein